MVVTATFPIPALTQDKPADNIQILCEKIRADKRLLVTANLELTESEAKSFWPVYEEYQKELTRINPRIVKLTKVVIARSEATWYSNMNVSLRSP